MSDKKTLDQQFEEVFGTDEDDNPSPGTIPYDCPHCGGKEAYQGYGFAAGALGAYTICANDACGRVLEHFEDHS